MNHQRPLRLTMIAPTRMDCGVADYTRYLVHELESLSQVCHVAPPDEFTSEMNDVDIVHIQHQYFVFGGVAPWKNRFKRLVDRLKTPAVMTVHEFVPPTGNFAARAAIAASNRVQFEHPAVLRLITHTEMDRDRMIRSGIPPGRVSLVRHGIPNPPVLPHRDDARSALGLSDRFVVTIFGYISQKKGHLLAIEAVRRLPDDVTLIIAGGRHFDDTTPHTSTLEEAILKYEMADRVRITGYLPSDRVALVMSATDLALAPFTESSGSGSLALGFACARPILASDIPPHQEIARGAVRPLQLFMSGSPDALAEEILRLRNEPDIRAELSANAAEYSRANSYARAAEQMVEIYRDVLGEVSD